jgi:acyl carrier protein
MMPRPFNNELIVTDLKETTPDMLSVMSLHDSIATLFSEKLNIEVASVETDLMETGVLDSLAFVELLLYLEQKFGVNVSLENLDLENFRSIASIANFIESRNGNGNGKNHYNGFGDLSRSISV